MRQLLLAVTAAAVFSLMLGSTALAAGYKPDARVRLSAISFPPPTNCGPTQHFNNPWKGNNVYNTTGKSQTYTGSQYSGGDCFVTFQVQISFQNDGANKDRFTVSAPGPTSTSGWTLKYMRGSTNVTLKVANGTYQTPVLAHGATDMITLKASYLGGENLNRLITMTSVGGGTKDAVRVVVNETP